MHNMDNVIHGLHTVQMVLNVNNYSNLQTMQYTKGELEKFSIQCTNIMNDYIQKILQCLYTESGESRPLFCTG